MRGQIMEINYREDDNELTTINKKKRKKRMMEVSLSEPEVQTYLAKVKKSSRMVGIGVWLIMTGVSAVTLLGNVGIMILFLTIAIAVTMFILAGYNTSEYEELEDKPIYLDDHTYEVVNAQRTRLLPRNGLGIALGVGLILLAVGAISAFGMHPAVLLFTIGFSVFLFITAGTSLGTYDHLLSKGDYAKYNTRRMIGHAKQSTPSIPTTVGSEPKMPVMPIVDNNTETDKIVKAGNGFAGELRAAKDQISNPNVLANIDEIIDITYKIMHRVQDEPELISSTQQFFDYYLPTTTKLVVNYGKIKNQDIPGQNISGTMAKIESTLSNLTRAYKSQLNRLYVDTSVDLETDISALEAMLKKEGLFSDDPNDLASFLNQ